MEEHFRPRKQQCRGSQRHDRWLGGFQRTLQIREELAVWAKLGTSDLGQSRDVV